MPGNSEFMASIGTIDEKYLIGKNKVNLENRRPDFKSFENLVTFHKFE